VKEARYIRNFEGEYTGLDTLIRIDGYYYHEHYSIGFYDTMEFRISPIVFLGNGKFRFSGSARTHENLQEIFFLRPFNGYYTVSGDTIKTKSARKFQLQMYDLHEEYFLIENDTTLRRIRWKSTTCPNRDIREEGTNDVYRFYKYPPAGADVHVGVHKAK